MVSTRGTRSSSRVKAEPTSVKAEASSDGGVLAASGSNAKKKPAAKKPAAKKSAAKKKAPAKKAKPKKVSVDLRSARTKERGSKVLDELKKNAAGADSRSQKLAQKFIAKGRAAKGSIAVSHIPGTEDTVRYEIEAAKSGRSVCKKSGRPIPKGALRWQVYQNNIGRGWILLECVTPIMIRNAARAHGSIDKIHGFESMPPHEAVRVCEVLKDILKTGGRNVKKGKKKGKKKPAKKKGGKKQAAVDEQEEEVDDDDEILVAATETLDEVLARKLEEAKIAGNVLEIDMSDDEEEPPSQAATTTTTTSTTTTTTVAKKFEKVKPMEVDSGSEYEEEEEVEGTGVELPERPPAEGDMIFVRWDGDDRDYLCFVYGPLGAQEIESADGGFEDRFDFDYMLDMWRFSTAATKAAPKPSSHPEKKKPKTAENPKLLKKKLKASVGAGGKALEGLTFVITGATEDRPRDEFGDYVCALVEANGGVIRSAISGKTDYLVCGTYHFNPFLGTVGAIENGSKYRKAKEKGTNITDLEGLEALIAGGGEI